MSPRRKTAVDRRNEQVRAGQRAAARRPCPACKADTFHGLDGDVLAFTVTTDVAAVGAAAELVAYADGRATFALFPNPTGVELVRRDQWQIRGTPAGTRGAPQVVAEHQCPGQPTALPDPNGGAGLFDLPPATAGLAPNRKERPRA